MPSAALAVAAVPLAISAGCIAEGAKAAAVESSEATVTSAPPASAPSDPPLDGPFEDDFERAELGPDWLALSPVWRIEGGRLCGRGARNRGVWLKRTLPTVARIEVTAIAASDDGDLKLELWGDGRSGAKGATYDHATGYVAILGGWRNQRHVLARLDEHGDDRLELVVDPSGDDRRRRAVIAHRPVRFVFERTDEKTLRWEVDGVIVHEMVDEEPLRGPGHDHLGFNDWEAPVCFDDLRIEPRGVLTH